MDKNSVIIASFQGILTVFLIIGSIGQWRKRKAKARALEAQRARTNIPVVESMRIQTIQIPEIRRQSDPGMPSLTENNPLEPIDSHYIPNRFQARTHGQAPARLDDTIILVDELPPPYFKAIGLPIPPRSISEFSEAPPLYSVIHDQTFQKTLTKDVDVLY